MTPLEQFSAAGSAVVEAAEQQARGLGHNYIGTEHLLLAEIAREEALGSGPLRDRQLTRERLQDEILIRLDHQTSEADALRAVGVDPISVVESARSQLGVELQIGGLAQPTPSAVGPLSDVDDAIPFTRRAFKVLNLAIGIAGGDKAGPRHILQALIEEDGGLAVVVLDHLGVDLDGLQAELSSSGT